MAVKTYIKAIRDTLEQEMRRDERVFVMGEDVEVGGVFGATRGLKEAFGPERCRNTAISESAIVGAALGAACCGLRPVAELMYMDFAFVAADQLINQVAKTRYIFGGKAVIPLVIRGQQGVGRGNAATHSQSMELLFTHWPGLKVVMPATPADAAGLLRASIRENNPVIFIEHKALYAQKGEVPEDPDFVVPLGKARIVREGRDVTILATHLYVEKALSVAERLAQEGIEAEIIDPRTVSPMDYESCVASVNKTGRALMVHEAHRCCGLGAEWAAELSERCFAALKAPILRLGAKACPLPFNLGLENAVVPQEEEIYQAVKQLMGRKTEACAGG